MKLRERVPYSAIVDREPWRLPGGKRVAVWPLVTVEVWDPDGPLPRTHPAAAAGRHLRPGRAQLELGRVRGPASASGA